MQPFLVAGTGSWKDNQDADWYCPGHLFGQFLTQQGVAPIYDVNGKARPFVWSTDLGGTPWTGKKDWAAGGAALAYFVMARQGRAAPFTAAIVHSHGLQVAAYAAAEHGLKFKTLISVGSPIRADLTEEYKALRANTGYWLHLHSDGSDRWQWLGELFDQGNPFTWRIVRDCPFADRNDFVPHVGHSQLLRDPAQYHFWIDRKWIDVLKG